MPDVVTLQRFGMELIDTKTMVEMVKQDLKSPSSRMKSTDTDENWHSAAAKMLSILADCSDRCLDLLHGLDLLPIRQPPSHATSWVSSADTVGVLFAQSAAGISIPEDVYPWVLEPKASRNQARVKLFKKLGVSTASDERVREMILKRHQEYLRQSLNPVVTSRQVDFLISQLCYLCKTQSSASTRERLQVALIDHHCRWWSLASQQPLYILDDEPFGPRELFRKTTSGDEPASGAPGLEALFLNPDISSLQSERFDLEPKAWVSWLISYAGLRNQVMLVNRGTDRLSVGCRYVATYRPEKFLGFLQHTWATEGKFVKRSTSMLEELRSFTALCAGNQLVPFRKTYLPLLDLQETCDSFLEPGHSFPFLNLQTSMRRETYEKLGWSFLIDSAGVNVNDGLTFYLDVLRHLSQSPADQLQNHDSVVRLYGRILAKCDESPPGADRKTAEALIMSVLGRQPHPAPFSDVYLSLWKGDSALTQLQQRLFCKCEMHLRA